MAFQVIHTQDGVVYRVADDPDLRREAQRLRHDVYLDKGYIKDPFLDGIISDKYDESSTFIVALDHDQDLMGTICLTPGPPFNTLEIWKDKLYPGLKEKLQGKIIEIGSLATKKAPHAVRISWGLYKACWLMALLEEVDWWIISVDARVFRILERLGWLMETIGPPLHYLGSSTVPAILLIKKQLSVIYEKNPLYYQYLVSS